MYKLGDTGLVVEYVNYMLGVQGNKFTEETENRLKQYQQAYNVEYVDSSDKLYYNDYEDYVGNNSVPSLDNYIDSLTSDYFVEGSNNGIGTDTLWLYPNGVVNLPTLTALTDVDIKTNNVNRIKLAQSALQFLGYKHQTGIDSDGNPITIPIQITGFIDEATQDGLRQFQKDYKIYQPYNYIFDDKNILTNNWVYINETNTQTFTDNFSEGTLIAATTNLPGDEAIDVIVTGSVSFSEFTYNTITYNITDDANGNLINGTDIVGSIDYTTGNFTLNDITAPSTTTVTYTCIPDLSVGIWADGNIFAIPDNTLDYVITDFIDGDTYQVTFFDPSGTQIPYDTLYSADSRYGVFGANTIGNITPNSVQGSNIIPAYLPTSDSDTIFGIKITIQRTNGLLTTTDTNNYKMQIEQASTGTTYEPNAYTEYNVLYSGKLDIPTYNMIKYVCNLSEVM